MTREQAEQEVRETNTFWRVARKQKFSCEACDGRGRLYVPLYGDPAVGYGDGGKCRECNGTGKEN